MEFDTSKAFRGLNNPAVVGTVYEDDPEKLHSDLIGLELPVVGESADDDNLPTANDNNVIDKAMVFSVEEEFSLLDLSPRPKTASTVTSNMTSMGAEAVIKQHQPSIPSTRILSQQNTSRNAKVCPLKNVFCFIM